MKLSFKIFLGVVILLLVTLISINFLSKRTFSGSEAFGKVFKSVEDIDNSSEIIVKGKIKPSIGKEKFSTVTHELYPIEITEVIKNTSNHNLVKYCVITLYKTIEFEGKEKIEEGEYILFLNTYTIDG